MFCRQIIASILRTLGETGAQWNTGHSGTFGIKVYLCIIWIKFWIYFMRCNNYSMFTNALSSVQS